MQMVQIVNKKMNNSLPIGCGFGDSLGSWSSTSISESYKPCDAKFFNTYHQKVP